MPAGNGSSGQNRLPAPKPPETGRRRPDEAPSDTLKGFTQRVLLALLIAGLAYLAYRGADVLLEVFAGVLLAVYLAAITEWFSRHTGLRYRWSLVAVVIAHAAA